MNEDIEVYDYIKWIHQQYPASFSEILDPEGHPVDINRDERLRRLREVGLAWVNDRWQIVDPSLWEVARVTMRLVRSP